MSRRMMDARSTMLINFRARATSAQLHICAKRELRGDVLRREQSCCWKSIPERCCVLTYIHVLTHSPLIFRDNLARRSSSRHDGHAQFQRLIHHYHPSLRGTSNPLRASFRVSTPYLSADEDSPGGQLSLLPKTRSHIKRTRHHDQA